LSPEKQIDHVMEKKEVQNASEIKDEADKKDESEINFGYESG